MDAIMINDSEDGASRRESLFNDVSDSVSAMSGKTGQEKPKWEFVVLCIEEVEECKWLFGALDIPFTPIKTTSVAITCVDSCICEDLAEMHR